MKKFLIGAAAAALFVMGCQAGEHIKYTEVEISAASTEVKVSSGDNASLSRKAIVITSEPSVVMSDVEDTVTVTGSQVNIRSSASTSAQVLGVANQGETFKRTGKGDSWSRVLWDRVYR